MSSLTLESEILKPLAPVHTSEKYEASWPIFLLRNAIVTDKAGNVVSLITASAQNLLVVSGELVQRKEQARHYASGLRRKTVYLEINPVGRYAFGLSDDDQEELWAAGRSGWFALEPATTYMAVYNEMREGIRLWYAIVDNPKLQSATAKDLFVPFLKKKDMKSRTAEDVFRQHADFVLKQMGQSLAAWSKKPLYQCLKKLQKEVIVESEVVPAPLKPAMANTTQPREIIRRRGRPAKTVIAEQPKTLQRKKKTIQTPVDDLHRIETDAAILWKFLSRYASKVAAADFGFHKIATLVHQMYVFDNERQAANYIRFHSKYFIRIMSERRELKYWNNTPFYHEIMESNLSQSMTGKMAKIVLEVRKLGDVRPAERMAKGGLDVYISSDEEIQPHHRKSGLRPKSGGKGKSYTANVEVEEDEMSNGSATPKKRKVEDDGIMQRRSKRRALSVAQSSDVSSSVKDELEHKTEIEGDDEEPRTGDKTLPLRWKDVSVKAEFDHKVPVLLTGANLQTAPNAPGDVWRCTTLGCMQSIYGASGALGKRLIDEHLLDHQDEEAPPQLDIIMTETKKTNLPVSNLIRRIREFAAAKELAEAVAGADDKDSASEL